MIPNVIEIPYDALHWEFHRNKAFVYVEGGAYRGQTEVDPFPCYAHDAALVRELAAALAERFPIDWPVTFNLLQVDTPAGTNGWTQVEQHYTGDPDNRPVSAAITFAGKRIPPHPAVTRYLVAHEYGHVIEEWLNLRRDGATLHDDGLITEYMRLRGLTKPAHYGGRTWHATPGEVFANDFRILVCGVEEEFWPHPGIARPERADLEVWWRGRLWDARKAAEAAGSAS